MERYREILSELETAGARWRAGELGDEAFQERKAALLKEADAEVSKELLVVENKSRGAGKLLGTVLDVASDVVQEAL